MDNSAEEIAAELRAAADNEVTTQEVLARRFADSVELRHIPPHPTDGPIPGPLLGEVSAREVAAVGRALRDRDDSDADITIDGDAVRVRRRTRGMLADGTKVDVRTSTRFVVADGAIVGLESDMDTASMEAWGKVLAAGAFEMPADMLARYE
jgi:ketosteroid isomerase-like protein